MELKGKCKEVFKKWYIQKYNHTITYDFFECMPQSMQFGVYVDFFDSVDIQIDIFAEDDELYHITIGTDALEGLSERPRARERAIEKANELFNQ